MYQGKQYYTFLPIAYKVAKLQGKTVQKELIEVVHKTYFKEIDVYTGKKVVMKKDGVPLVKREYLVKTYGYLIV